MWLARRSCPRLRSSACRRRRSTRSPYWDAAGRGAEGGGPAAAKGRGVAGLEVVEWMQREWGAIVGGSRFGPERDDTKLLLVTFIVETCALFCPRPSS